MTKKLHDESSNINTKLKIKNILYQLLSGLSYCHLLKILHRDIKPQNILMDNNENIKIIDFGLARTYESIRPFTIEVVSLWYRAPEILLGQTEYTAKVDVWAVGCIFGELLFNKVLFKGENELDQLTKIFR